MEILLPKRLFQRLLRHATAVGFATAGLVWLITVAIGLSVLWSYDNTPGAAGAAPYQWPGATRIPRPQARPALVLLLHPECTCSRATVAELARLMARVQGRVDAHVLFLSPEGMGDTWSKSALWSAASSIPGVQVVRDDRGEEARHFGAATSGETLLYDTTGRLRFDGGITGSRGHEGDNAGRSSLESLLTGGTAERSSTFVFGCALFAPAEQVATNRTSVQ